MKTYLIAVGLCAALMGCGSSPTEQHSTTNQPTENYSLGGSGGEGPLPCGYVYDITFTTDAGTFHKEVPVYCNPNGDPYHGDPCPDCGDPSPERQQGDPDPWNKQTVPSYKEKVNVESFVGGQRSSR